MLLLPIDIVLAGTGQIGAEGFALFRGKAAQHDLLDLRAFGHPGIRRFQTSVCYRQQIATAVASIRLDGDKAALFQRIHHPRNRRGIDFKVVRQVALATGP